MKVSIIIPTHNRADALEKTLTTLAQQEFQADWEVIVVNNNCTDNTDEIIGNQTFPVPLFLEHESTPGASAARNRGARKARSEIIIFIDNDILVPKNFIQHHVESLEANPKCWFVGRVVNPPALRETVFGRYRDDLHKSYFQNLLLEKAVEYNGATGQNWAMRNQEFFCVGGFDEELVYSGEDAELALRARQKGIRTMFDPQSTVIHNDWAIDLDSFCKRQEIYAISTVLLWRKYGVDSFQLEVVKENSPVDLRSDSARLIAKKVIKGIFSTTVGYKLTKIVARLMEKILPDTKLSYRAYEMAIAVAIFRGVREGFRRYQVDEFGIKTP